MYSIYSFLQKPICFDMNGVKGNIWVAGNTNENLIQFQVQFDNKDLLIPLLLTVKDYRGKVYNIFLMLKDENKATISSHLYEPEYLIRKGIIIKDIRPLVILEEEKNDDTCSNRIQRK